MGRLSLTRLVLLSAVVGTAACTVQQMDVPPVTGPSEFSLSLDILANPDTLTQDGVSQSTVGVTARGPDGMPVSGRQFRLTMVVNGATTDFGTLSTRNVTTGADGRATATYTAPLASPFQAGAPPTQVAIYATPIGTNFTTASSQFVSLLLLTPPVPAANPNAPTAAVTFTPAAPKVGDLVTFDASGSVAAPGRQIVSYYWNFGDGQPNDETGVDASHVYVVAGTYTMILGVVDDAGQISSTFRTITVVP
jgi:PKD repeat protein